MQAGRLRHRVTIEAVTKTKDARGQHVETWVPVETVWANVRQPAGREAMQVAQVSSETTWKIEMRYRSDLTSEHRLVYGSRTLKIISVIDVGERRRMLEIDAKENDTDDQ